MYTPSALDETCTKKQQTAGEQQDDKNEHKPSAQASTELHVT